MQTDADKNMDAGLEPSSSGMWLAESEYVSVMSRLERRLERYKGGVALLDVSYVGIMPFTCVNRLLDLIRSSLEGMPYLHIQQRRRLNQVAVELLQNVSRHGYDGFAHGKNARRPLGFGVLRVEEETVRVATANLSTKEDAQRVQDRVVQLNNFTYDQLRALHKVQLTSGKISDLGGAGLGLLDVLKRSRHSIGVYRESVSERLDLLELSSIVPTELAQ